MTLTQLRYFAAIIDAGLNITIAARNMHGKQLEAELGFQLFSRRARTRPTQCQPRASTSRNQGHRKPASVPMMGRHCAGSTRCKARKKAR